MDNRRVAELYGKAVGDQDLELLGGVMHDEIVVRYPQVR